MITGSIDLTVQTSQSVLNFTALPAQREKDCVWACGYCHLVLPVDAHRPHTCERCAAQINVQVYPAYAEY